MSVGISELNICVNSFNIFAGIIILILLSDI